MKAARFTGNALAELPLMEYRTALFFLFLYYIRPQDWIPALIGFNIIRPMILLWIISFATSRRRSATPGILKTPHDWAMLAYYLYVSWNSADFSGTLKAFLPYVVFYAFTVHSLTSWERVLGYIKGWNFMLMGVAAMAIGSLFGVDLTNAADVTMYYEGRLSLGTWMHNNPNALAHSVIVVMPLSYVLYFWKKGVIGRLIVFPACTALACFCVYETQSKGAFLVGGVLFVLIFVVGRPKSIQILALAMAATLGVSALSFLPRMEQMSNLKADEGVQGRLMVWELARNVTKTKSEGDGWKQFVGHIVWQGQWETKATHSSYVQVGGDLGINGLFCYLLPLWLAIRSLLVGAKMTRDDPDKERCRRAIMILVIAYLISGWMINREYHTEYFLLVAAAAAIHRLNLANELGIVADTEEDLENASLAPSQPQTDALALPPQPLEEIAEGGKRLWNRITLVDVAAGAAMTQAVLFTWDYVLENL